jgi:hypothetical protein
VDALMREGGIVLLHDTNPEGCGWLGPRALLESLGREADAAYHWLNLPTPEGFGLALVQKRSKSMTRWRANISDLVADWFHRRTSR